jgi:hypothetical protein
MDLPSRRDLDVIYPQWCDAITAIGCTARTVGCALLSGPALAACVASVAPDCLRCVVPD